MQIKHEHPPFYDRIVELLGEQKNNVVYTVGATLYIPSGRPPADHVIEHEMVHTHQQGKQIELWWDRYLEDPQFRLAQETEAYRAQYKFYKMTHKDRNAVARFLFQIAGHLSGDMYNNLVTLQQAQELIKGRAAG